MSSKYAATAAVALAVAAAASDASMVRLRNQIGAGSSLLRPVDPSRFNPLVNRTRLFEEDEWEFNAGIQGGQGRPQWNVGISHKWEEEEESEQKLKIGKALKKIAKIASTAAQLGLLDEEAEDEAQNFGRNQLNNAHMWEEEAEAEEQKLKIGKVLKKAAKIASTAAQLGLLEEEESEQKFKLGKALKKAAKILAKAHEIGVLEEEEGANEAQKIKLGKALKKVGRVLAKAHEIGLLEEDEWQVNAGISGGQGRPQWQVGVSHQWDEEEQKFKLGKTLKKVAKVAAKAHDMGLLEEENDQEQFFPREPQFDNFGPCGRRIRPCGVRPRPPRSLLEDEDEAQWNSPTFPVNPRPYM